MGVRTSGDEKRNEVNNTARSLVSQLAELLYGHYWGDDEWTDEARADWTALLQSVDHYVTKHCRR